MPQAHHRQHVLEHLERAGDGLDQLPLDQLAEPKQAQLPRPVRRLVLQAHSQERRLVPQLRLLPRDLDLTQLHHPVAVLQPEAPVGH